jgi:hypothetical protein
MTRQHCSVEYPADDDVEVFDLAQTVGQTLGAPVGTSLTEARQVLGWALRSKYALGLETAINGTWTCDDCARPMPDECYCLCIGNKRADLCEGCFAERQKESGVW